MLPGRNNQRRFQHRPKQSFVVYQQRGPRIDRCLSTEKPGRSLKNGSASKAEILDAQFKPVFTEEDLANRPRPKGESPYHNMNNIEVSEKRVFKLFQILRPNKVIGPDSIPAFILKTGAKKLAPVLTINLPTISGYWTCAI